MYRYACISLLYLNANRDYLYPFFLYFLFVSSLRSVFGTLFPLDTQGKSYRGKEEQMVLGACWAFCSEDNCGLCTNGLLLCNLFYLPFSKWSTVSDLWPNFTCQDRSLSLGRNNLWTYFL